jgi:hypothetical protein
VQCVFCDGSVHWINDTINLGSEVTTTTSTTNPDGATTTTSTTTITLGVWDCLNLSNDGNTFQADAY